MFALKRSWIDLLTLKQRLLLGMAIIALPLIATSVTAYVLLTQTVDQLSDSYDEVNLEMLPVIKLQTLLLASGMPANDYLISGNTEERTHFQALARELDLEFEQALEAPYGNAQKRFFVENSRTLWIESRALSEQILALESPVSNAEGNALMETLDSNIHRAESVLSGVYELALDEIAEQYAKTQRLKIWAGILLVLISIIVGMMAVFGFTLLQRWIIAPLNQLTQGSINFAQGDLIYRLPDTSSDEIGQVAQAFNRMADALQRDRAALVELASHDALTGLFNVREFHQRLELELARAHRHGHRFAVLMLDIDHFKAVNDTHGHPTGDAALTHIAKLIQGTLRPNDIAARYGGEEFVILLPETDAGGAAQLAERLRGQISATPFYTDLRVRLDLSASIGLSCYPADATTVAPLIAAADKALYAAKKGGRNRVCSYHDSLGN